MMILFAPLEMVWLAMAVGGLVVPASIYPLQLGGLETSAAIVLAGIAVVGTLIVVLTVVILGKSVLARRRDRRADAVRRSVREAFYRHLADPEPDWESLVDSLSSVERRVLEDELKRSTDLLEGEKGTELSHLAEVLDLRSQATSAVESDSRYGRLRGLKLFIAFEWRADPEWILSSTSDNRDESEAAIRALANHPDRLTRLTGVEIARRLDGLSVYGMDALYRLVREDPTPMLEELTRWDRSNPLILMQLLRVLEHSETLTGEAPMDGVLACLEHDSPGVRRSACAVLADYGWLPAVRDRVDLNIDELFSDPSRDVRISTYRMLANWDDAAARSKLATAADVETDSRALFVIACGLSGEARQYLDPETHDVIDETLEEWAEVYELRTRQHAGMA